MDYKRLADQEGPRTGITQEWVFRVLRRGIVTGQLKPGTQLKQDEISAALNVSHIPVREALRQLETQCLVRIYPNRGATVTKLSRTNILEMMEVRASLSVLTLNGSVDKLTDEDLSELEEIIAAQRYETETFTEEELNYRFHEVLGRHAENSIVDMFMDMIHANIDRYLRDSFYGDPSHRSVSISEHEAILAACKARDKELACSLLRDHILNAKRYIPDTIED